MKVNGLRHGLLDGLCNKDIWRENTECIKTKKHRQSSDYQCFLPVGVTGFEPATTRPPDAYSNRAELHPELRMQRYGFFWYLQIFSVLFYIKSASFYARY